MGNNNLKDFFKDIAYTGLLSTASIPPEAMAATLHIGIS